MRLEQVEPVWLREVLEFLEASVGELRAAADTQVGFALLADQALDLGLVRYAGGASTDAVREPLAEAAGAIVRVFELREAPDADRSLANARRSLLGMYLAAAVGQPGQAEALARLAGDAPASGTGGIEEQQLAAALRALLLERGQEALDALPPLGRADPELDAQTAAVAALVRGEPGSCRFALEALLERHAAAAPQHPRDPLSFACVPALGLAALALGHGVVRRDELPSDDVFLPLKLLSAVGSAAAA